MKSVKLKKISLFVLIGAMILSIVGCTQTDDAGEKDSSNDSGQQMKIALELTTAGLGDKNFNDMAYNGLTSAKEELGVDFDYAEPQSVGDYETQLRAFAESEEYELIIALSFDQADALISVAEEFTDQKFLILDSKVELPNVSSIVTRFEEQTFLTGVIAGLVTQDERVSLTNEENAVGVILGQETPNLKAGVVGFTAGAKYVNPDVEVFSSTVGSFADPGKAKEMALSMYDRGADSILHIAGASGMGVFNAAKEADRYAFGVGGNQNYIDPDRIIGTALRNVHQLIFDQAKKISDGTWEAGAYNWGIKEDAVGYDLKDSNVELPQDIIDKVEDVKAKIVAGELQLPSTIEELDSWTSNNKYE